jgi:hypothetical protein
VSLTPAKHVFAGVSDTGNACIAGVVDTVDAPMHLKEQSVNKQAISRYYFSVASIQSSKESSNYNKIVCITGVIDTGDAPEKSNISANIQKNLNRY